MLGIITGLIYTLLLTRNMSKAEYGIWTNIFDYTAYFVLFSSVFLSGLQDLQQEDGKAQLKPVFTRN